MDTTSTFDFALMYSLLLVTVSTNWFSRFEKRNAKKEGITKHNF